MKKIYCTDCNKVTNHIPKMDALKDGKMVCEECSHMNTYCTLIKPVDNKFIKKSLSASFVEWNNDKTFKQTHKTPRIGLSLIMDPSYGLAFAWLSSIITEIVEEKENYVKFKTENSLYELYYSEPYNTKI